MAPIPTPSIPIAQLRPGLDPEATSVTGIVTLIWPYASAIQSTSLLLVEPDFRLRRHWGQVRIRFNGASAKAVARAGVSSGDRLSLSLTGSEWEKIGSAATTPGKSIQWELRYGERVVLQAQRRSREPVLLDIDHPPPSPPSATDASTPHRSPPYNGHIAISTRGPLLSAQTWESPAFLKRSQFISSYDPLVTEEEEDFLDNDRRKRSKFGRGSGQWRFADRTPSPEKDHDLNEFEFTSPSKPHHEEQGIYDRGLSHLQRSQKIEGHAGVNDEEQGICELTEDADDKAKTYGELNGVGQQVHGATQEVDDNAVLNAPLSPPSTAVELSEAEALTEATPVNQAASSSSRSVYSVSASPESNQEWDSEAEEQSGPDDYNGAAFSGPASDFGLDGSVFSRTQLPPKERQIIATAIEEGERMEATNRVNRPSEQEALSPSASDSGRDRQKDGEQSVTIKESAHEFQILDGDDSIPTLEHETVQQEIQDMSGVSPTTSVELREEQILERPFPEAVKMPPNADLQGLPSEETTVEINQRATTIEVQAHIDSQLAEPRETRKDKAELAASPLKARVSKVEIIDLESEDVEEDVTHVISQQPTRSPSVDSGVSASEKLAHLSGPSTPAGIATLDEPPPLRSRTSSPSIAEFSRDAVPQPDLTTAKPAAQGESQSPASSTSNPSIVEDVRDDFLQSAMGAEKPSFQEEPAGSTHGRLADTVKRVSGPQDAQDTRTDRSEPEIGAKQTPLSDEPAEPMSQREATPVAKPAFSPQSTKGELPPKLIPGEIKKRTGSQGPLVELPATVQDSAQGLSAKSQLLTPDTTQRTSFASQPSSNSLQSISDDDTLPTPRLTQGKSADLVVPIALQISQEPSPARSAPPLEKYEPVEKQRPLEKAPVPQRQPTLIEKLKAMRRLSSHTPQRMGDASAISTWFAPKRSSIVVPDSEAESEIESLSEGDRRSIRQSVAAKLRTPEKQKIPAKSFIRSPQREGARSIASSPGYLPPSQPPPPGFRTSLSYFVPLATLQSHFTLAVDVLAIVLSATPVTRATFGPKDYNQTIYITDPSSSLLRSPIITAQIFRSHNKCFPIVEEGDALLLRDFKVQSFQRQLSLLSTQSSAWAVFLRDADVQIRGPPVEFGAEERGFARGLWRWWAGLDQKVKDGLVNGVPRDKNGKAIPPDNKPIGRIFSKEKRVNDIQYKSDVKVKKEGIAGLGVDLPGSQEKMRIPFEREKSPELEVDLPRSQGRTRKALQQKERSLGLDGVLESTEPPKRVLRPRGARGMAERSESPMKALNRRSGTVFTGGLGEPESD